MGHDQSRNEREVNSEGFSSKKIREEDYKKLTKQLKILEQQHKIDKDETILQQIINVRWQIHDILNQEVEKN